MTLRFLLGMSAVLVTASFNEMLCGDDWPMWRYDANRSAASRHELPEKLVLRWSRRFPPRSPAWDDPLNQDLMTYDRILEPIIADGRLILGFNDTDQVSAFDLQTGQKLWTCFAEGPVRFPPVAWNERVYFSSDDGWLYCVKLEDGQIVWRFRGGPNNRQVLGNKRMTSAWPMRGGPVIRDGVVYCAAGIWPFMGTYIYAINAESGQVLWVNDETGSQYIKQPHSAPSFAGIAPQGALVATENVLLVPGGRSVPAAFDRKSGKQLYFELNAGGKGTGGSFLCANEHSWFVHTRQRGTREFSLDNGIKTAFQPNEPVLTEDLIYASEVLTEPAQPNAETPATTTANRAVVRGFTPGTKEQKVEYAVDARGDLIKVGHRLYSAALPTISMPKDSQAAEATSVITAIDLEASSADRNSQWNVAGTVERLIAGHHALVAVTTEGWVHMLGDSASQSPAEPRILAETITPLGPSSPTADALRRCGNAEGYAILLGADDQQLALSLANESPWSELVIVESDASRVAQLRTALSAAGVYGRVTVRNSAIEDFSPPPYVAHQIFVAPSITSRLISTPEQLERIYQSVRPYGGVMVLMTSADHSSQVAQVAANTSLEQAVITQSEISQSDVGVIVRREGPLPGAGEWTHQYGNIANTIKSNDTRVRLPLGVLWFGGVSHDDVLPRHGHGPPEQVVGGRLFIQGMDSLTARDVYTGRVLWQRKFTALGTHDVYFDDTYKDTPLDPAYNQVHIPGANGRGTNYVVASDRIYLLEGATCHVLDPATGETLFDIELPQDDPAAPREWGFIGVYENILLGGVGFAQYKTRHELDTTEDAKLTGNKAAFGLKSLDRAASLALVAFDRHSGKVLWKNDARHSFWHNGIVAGNGKVFAIDRNPKPVEDFLKRRGKSDPSTYRLVAFDATSGQTVWEQPGKVFGTWLSYSEQEDLLLHAGASASDRLSSETGQGMSVFRGDSGELVWEKPELKYSGPCVLHNGLIITNANAYTKSAGAFRLTDGSQKLVLNPLTGKEQPWSITRAYGCNSIIASENLLTFRSGAAGFYDLLTESGTGNLGGFKSGCTSNLVVADGVLNAPDYTRTCSCAYQNQTSLALVHMPELDLWTMANAEMMEPSDGRLQKLGVNLGAPGDRRAPDGTMWLEYPAVAGEAPNFALEIEGDHRIFVDQSLLFSQDAAQNSNPDLPPWVASSGIEGASRLRFSLKPVSRFKLRSGIPISSAADDAEETPDGEVSLDSSSLELGQKDEKPQLVGLRFTGVRIAQGASIPSAHLQFVVRSDAKEPAEFRIRAEATGNAAMFTEDKHNLSQRRLTQSEVVWSPSGWEKEGTADAGQKSPDVSPIIREIVHRQDWKPGNSIVFVVQGSGTRVAAPNRGADSTPARLIVDADEAAFAPEEIQPPEPYRLELKFALPIHPNPNIALTQSSQQINPPETRSFEVTVAGADQRETVTLGGSHGRFRTVAFNRVLLQDWLDIEFRSIEGQPVISGFKLERLNE